MNAVNLYALPTTQPAGLRPIPPSPAEKVTTRFGLVATAIATSLIIIALLLNVSSSRQDATAARREATAAQAETVRAQEAASASDVKAQTEHAAALSANSALTSKTQQLTDLRAVAVRANNCIDATFPIMTALVNEQWTTASRLLSNLTTLCAGLGPLLRGTATS